MNSENDDSKNEYLMENDNTEKAKDKYFELIGNIESLRRIKEKNDNELIQQKEEYDNLKKETKEIFLFLFIMAEDFIKDKDNPKIKKLLSKIETNKLKEKEKDFKNITNDIDVRIKKNPFLSGNTEEINVNNNDELLNDIQFQRLEKNDKFMKERTEIIQDAKELSAQIADLSMTLKDEVNKQGEMIDKVEDDVHQTNDNLLKALKENQQTEILTRNTNKRLYGLIFFIIILVILLIYFSINILQR